MMAAVSASENAGMKVSAMWLVGTYAVITLGELCLSPMGLSLVSKLSPSRLTAVMMGGWFLSTSIGNKLAGVLGHMGSDSENKSWARTSAANCGIENGPAGWARSRDAPLPRKSTAIVR